jgi:hypothetical protein
MEMLVEDPTLVDYRNLQQQAAIVFVHGFQGKAQSTWKEFPTFIAQDTKMDSWDIYSIGYSTHLSIDIVGVWAADPDLITVAKKLCTVLNNPPFDSYKSLALVAHSMGGLVVQRSLVDDPSLVERVSHVLFYGTPSNGLVKSFLVSLFKRQFRDMASNSDFIQDLRQRWKSKFEPSAPFRFLTVAGERDEFVTRTSSLDPFPIKQQAVIPGNHLEIINPSSLGDLKIQVLLKHLAGDTAPAGPWNSARIAVESRQFQQAIILLEPNKSGLDKDAIVTLALAYEGMDRGDDALALLEAHGGSSTDAMGTLAGRLKRRWLVYRQEADAERALQLYSDAFKLSQKSIKLAQAFYHGINIAFMYLAYRKDGEQAKIIASKVLDFSKQAPQDKWALATQGEALLILEDTSSALECYRQAVALKPELRELQSMYAQAITISKLKNLELESDLNTIFEESIK